MKPPIKPIGMFYTPQSVGDLQDYLERFSGNEAAVANISMAVTWNCCAKIIADYMQANMPLPTDNPVCNPDPIIPKADDYHDPDQP